MKYNKFIDHTLLKPNAIVQDYLSLFSEANKYDFCSVCIPASYIDLAKKHVNSNIKICTVVGFPLGYNNSKVEEARKAIDLGVHEVDMVINISMLKSKDFEYVKNEIQSVASINKNIITKVIIETDYLDETEKIMMCNIINDTDANFIKTKKSNIHELTIFLKFIWKK